MSQKIFIRPQTRKRTDGIKEKTVIFYALQIPCLQEGVILVMKMVKHGTNTVRWLLLMRIIPLFREILLLMTFNGLLGLKNLLEMGMMPLRIVCW